MAKWGDVDFSELVEFQQRLEKLIEQKDAFYRACGRDIAQRLLAKVIDRTPVGKYGSYKVVTAKRDGKKHKKGEQYKRWVKDKSGKTGGTLRRGWSANGVTIAQVYNKYIITIYNPVEYASYVEYGHRQTPGRYVPALGKRLKAGWVKGTYMLTFSEKEIERELPSYIERKVTEWLKECFK